jgi:hypothetical protein
MDYIHETRELLKEIFCTYWMEDNQIDKVIDDTLKASDITLEQLADIVEAAVKNGHSLQEQKEILSEIFT